MVLFAALLLLMGAGLAAMVLFTAIGNETTGLTLWLILAEMVAALVIVIVLETTEAAEANPDRVREG